MCCGGTWWGICWPAWQWGCCMSWGRCSPGCCPVGRGRRSCCGWPGWNTCGPWYLPCRCMACVTCAQVTQAIHRQGKYHGPQVFQPGHPQQDRRPRPTGQQPGEHLPQLIQQPHCQAGQQIPHQVPPQHIHGQQTAHPARQAQQEDPRDTAVGGGGHHQPRGQAEAGAAPGPLQHAHRHCGHGDEHRHRPQGQQVEHAVVDQGHQDQDQAVGRPFPYQVSSGQRRRPPLWWVEDQ